MIQKLDISEDFIINPDENSLVKEETDSQEPPADVSEEFIQPQSDEIISEKHLGKDLLRDSSKKSLPSIKTFPIAPR